MEYTTTLNPLAAEFDLSSFRLNSKSLGAIDRAVALHFYTEPSRRPPVLDEMMPDIERLIYSVAQRYSDQTSQYLQIEELVGEGRLKLAELITKGQLDKQKTRSNFFKVLKASLQNQAKSRIQKYRFTEKRTGIKPPPRKDRLSPESSEAISDYSHRQKQVEMSLDDTDLHLQVSDGSHSEQEWREVVEEYAALLTKPERVIFSQMVQPDEAAWAAAYVDSFMLKSSSAVTFKIKYHHMAEGLELKYKEFQEYVLSIKRKILAYRAMTDSDLQAKERQSAITAQLKVVFGVQIPPTSDSMLVRRLFTIAAREQYTKINAQVAEMLEAVGAKVPRLHKDMVQCYGVLYLESDRRCQSCGLKKSCYTEAANLGLTTITLSPRLLGARQTRQPVILPSMEGDAPVSSTYDEDEIISYLDENFVKFGRGADIYYGYDVEAADRQVLLFCLGSQMSPLRLRFCAPSDALKKKLMPKAKCWYPADDASTSEITALIEQHAEENLNGKPS